jgi:type IV secretion system protein VirB11
VSEAAVLDPGAGSASTSARAGVYLAAFLAPFEVWLQRDDITDILVNRPGEVWTETAAGVVERHDAPAASALTLTRLASQVARITRQGVSREHPLLSAALPGGERIQIVLPPATRADPALAIRKHVLTDLTLDDYGTGRPQDGPPAASPRQAAKDTVRALLAKSHRTEALRHAVQARLNVVVSGGTGTGKTTFLNALLKEIPATDRLIAIEDAPEIRLSQPNSVGLVAVKGETGEARVDVNDLMQAALRMRPDRIILGELRGKEAFTFLRAANSGHPGSITTLHADSPEGAFDQLALMAVQPGMARADIQDFARAVIDVVVQLERRAGARQIADVRVIG